MESAAERSLDGYHYGITSDRDVGNVYYLSGRKYPSGDAELVSIKLTHEDQLKKGGGAKRRNTEKTAMDDVTLNKSVARARTKVRRLCLTMCCDRLLTLTFRENLEDLDVAWDRFKYFTKLCRAKWGKKFRYVAVPEYQKRGAVHFHIAIAGYMKANVVRKMWRRAAGRYGGNIDITNPKKFGKGNWNPKRIANYISKYISKNDSVEFNKKRYSSGGDIDIPEPRKGYVCYGFDMENLMKTVIQRMSAKEVDVFWESDGFFGIQLVST